ncbi:unnamed protein product [Enterobius vermicularis]|uniref:NTR domain-containing protein n=1 Tax=Enterobius vermicularis TaxID=51028 RepID=A0A0N4UWT8_ENTVE|nr:unnamed protein product [Enterobius vermicularis]
MMSGIACLNAYVDFAIFLLSHVRVHDLAPKVDGQAEPETSENQTVYQVTHLEVFKLPEEFDENEMPTAVYTLADSASCGIELRKGKDYLLSGKVRKGKLTATTCDQLWEPDFIGDVMEWSDVSTKLKRELQNKYSEAYYDS